MVNMAVQYRGPDPSLITLTNELRAHYGDPARTYEFVTGYKSPGNYSGHNADSDGVVHAVDIFTDDHGNIPQAEGRALAERLRLIGKATGRFSYLIHDMSAGAPQPMIAGQHTGWLWQEYNGPDAHSDHIHVSIADLYWGDPCPVPAYVTNDTSRWGINSPISGQANNITPIQEDDLMATPEQRALLIQELLDTPIIRAERGGTTSLRSVIAHLDANLDKIPEEVVSFQFPKQGYNEKGVKFTDLKPAPMTSVKTELGWQDGGNIAIRNKVDQVKK